MKGAMADTLARWGLPRPEGNRFGYPDLPEKRVIWLGWLRRRRMGLGSGFRWQ